MASDLEFVNYKDFVESLPARTVAKSGDKSIVSNSTDGPGSETNAAQAQKVLAGNTAQEFDPARDEGHKYLAGESVAHEGNTYIFKVDHYGPWKAADVERTDIVDAIGVSDLSFADSNCTLSSSYDETKIGYYANTDGYHASNSCDTFVFEAKHNGNIYAQNYSVYYFSIVVFDDASQNSGTRYRKVAGGENTLPTEENPAPFVKGNYIAITAVKNVAFLCILQDYVFVRTIKDDVKLSDSQVSQVLSQVESIVDINYVDETFTLSSFYDETKTSQYANTDGYHESELYDTFVFEAQKDSTLFVSSSGNEYFSIVVFDNASQNSGVRYRKVYGGENTLPTEENPASFVKGNYIAITTKKDVNFSVICNDYKKERSLENDILFSQGQVNQIVALQKSKVVCRFVNSSGEGSSTQRFEIFVPTKVGYVMYQFVHSVDDEKNSDCWRIQSATAVSDDFTTRFALTSGGEWECSIRLDDRSDFSGGIVHGNEVLVDVAFWADGKILDLETLTSDLFFCSKFRVSSKTHLYDKADGTTNFADHGCEHVFSVEGCEISQSVKFIIDSVVQTAYMAMGLPAAAVTDKYYVDTDISAGSAVPVDTKVITSELRKFVVFGQNSGVLFSIELLGDYPYLDETYKGLLVHAGYNKTYFIIRYYGTYEVAANTLWVTKHRVNFEVGK